jgi:SAM-dependent methyltransferase
MFQVQQQVKAACKRVLPHPVIWQLRNLVANLRKPESIWTKLAFDRSGTTPEYLGFEALTELQRKYPFPPEYGYDPASLLRRGQERAHQLLQMPGVGSALDILELGCWDGMVSCMLKRQGKRTTAIDFRSKGFDERARAEGVDLREMDATKLEFDDASFDFVFSYDAFEHFTDPEAALRQALRVLRPGGQLFLSFRPLYNAPWGEHAYASITVPYCQHLFPDELLNQFAEQYQLTPIDFGHVNRWFLADYRALWGRYADRLQRVRYHEGFDLGHLDVIRRYPSCFRSKVSDFDELIVSSVDILLRRIG